MANNTNSKLSRVITVRFSQADFHKIAQAAEERNSTTADVIRHAWQEYLTQKSIDSQLIRFEKQLMRKIFELVVAVAGLDETERLGALKAYKSKLKEDK